MSLPPRPTRLDAKRAPRTAPPVGVVDTLVAQMSAKGGDALVLAGTEAENRDAATRLAARLRRPLQRVDLSAIVSPHLGETEKNLDRVFAEARAEGAVLWFDEADALLGKRTDVRDAHDRYANVETAAVLQRIEAHDGVALITTHAKATIDPAFLRRIRAVITFPKP